jgi:hypothetical protein
LFLARRFVLPWWRRLYVPSKHRFLQEPRGLTSQKTGFLIVTAVETSNLSFYSLLTLWGPLVSQLTCMILGRSSHVWMITILMTTDVVSRVQCISYGQESGAWNFPGLEFVNATEKLTQFYESILQEEQVLLEIISCYYYLSKSRA